MVRFLAKQNVTTMDIAKYVGNLPVLRGGLCPSEIGVQLFTVLVQLKSTRVP